MKERTLSTFALWAVLISTVALFDAAGAIVLVSVASLLTQRELYRMLSAMGQRPMRWLGMTAGAIMTLAPLLALYPCPNLRTNALADPHYYIAPTIVTLGIAALLRRPRGNPVNALGSTLLGLLLAPFTLVFLSLTILHFGPDKSGLWMALWLVMTTKFTDMGALCCGLAFGKHKMAPILSPKKTWEGAVGGTLITIASSAAFAHGAQGQLPDDFTPTVAAMLALPVALASIFADLLESAFKRESGIKDSGRMVPGIGGVFDLTDSFMLSAPLAYYATTLILAK
jgi:phosphatidate cytidylyltransferase